MPSPSWLPPPPLLTELLRAVTIASLATPSASARVADGSPTYAFGVLSRHQATHVHATSRCAPTTFAVFLIFNPAHFIMQSRKSDGARFTRTRVVQDSSVQPIRKMASGEAGVSVVQAKGLSSLRNLREQWRYRGKWLGLKDIVWMGSDGKEHVRFASAGAALIFSGVWHLADELL